MTEVADMMIPDHRVATIRHYEAGPPPGLELVSTVLSYICSPLYDIKAVKKEEGTNGPTYTSSLLKASTLLVKNQLDKW